MLKLTIFICFFYGLNALAEDHGGRNGRAETQKLSVSQSDNLRKAAESAVYASDAYKQSSEALAYVLKNLGATYLKTASDQMAANRTLLRIAGASDTSKEARKDAAKTVGEFQYDLRQNIENVITASKGNYRIDNSFARTRTVDGVRIIEETIFHVMDRFNHKFVIRAGVDGITVSKVTRFGNITDLLVTTPERNVAIPTVAGGEVNVGVQVRSAFSTTGDHLIATERGGGGIWTDAAWRSINYVLENNVPGFNEQTQYYDTAKIRSLNTVDLR